MGQGTRMILDFFPLRFLEAPTPLSYNLGWCYFPPCLIPSATNVHKIPDPQTNPPPSYPPSATITMLMMKMTSKSIV